MIFIFLSFLYVFGVGEITENTRMGVSTFINMGFGLEQRKLINQYHRVMKSDPTNKIKLKYLKINNKIKPKRQRRVKAMICLIWLLTDGVASLLLILLLGGGEKNGYEQK